MSIVYRRCWLAGRSSAPSRHRRRRDHQARSRCARGVSRLNHQLPVGVHGAVHDGLFRPPLPRLGRVADRFQDRHPSRRGRRRGRSCGQGPVQHGRGPVRHARYRRRRPGGRVHGHHHRDARLHHQQGEGRHQAGHKCVCLRGHRPVPRHHVEFPRHRRRSHQPGGALLLLQHADQGGRAELPVHHLVLAGREHSSQRPHHGPRERQHRIDRRHGGVRHTWRRRGPGREQVHRLRRVDKLFIGLMVVIILINVYNIAKYTVLA